MAKGRDVRGGPFNRVIEPLQEYTEKLVSALAGAIATDGVQYSSVVTVGTTATELFSADVDPGVDLRLKTLVVGLTQKLENLAADSVATVCYYWQARRKSQGTICAWVPLSGTLCKGVGTSLASEDTLSGLISVGTMEDAPLEVRLMASCLTTARATGKVKSSSYVQCVGNVIPGV